MHMSKIKVGIKIHNISKDTTSKMYVRNFSGFQNYKEKPSW